MILALVVAIPLLTTGIVVTLSSITAWSSREHAQAVVSDARQLANVASARAQTNRLELPFAAVSYAQSFGISETELDSLLHQSVPFRDQLAQQTAALSKYPIFTATPALRSDVASLKQATVGLAQGMTTFSDVYGFFTTMATDIDQVWYKDYNHLVADMSAWSPPGSFAQQATDIPQSYQAFLAGGQEIGNVIFVLEGVGPPNAKQELIQAAGVFAAATHAFGHMGPNAARAWRHLQTDPADLSFAATIDEAVTVALTGHKPPLAGNLAFAGTAMTPSLQYLNDLNKLVTAEAADLRQSAIAQAVAATHRLVAQTTMLAVLAIVCLAAIGLVGRILTRPLKRLANRALQVHDGDLDLAPLPDIGPRELVMATGAFNDMASTLHAVEAKAVALAAEDLSNPELVVPLPGRTGRALQTSVDTLATRIREREIQRQLLHEAATHDSLTGLLNRPAVLEYLSHDVSRRRDAGETVAVLFVDLDGLKPLNDVYGHEVGDAAIFATARALTHVTEDCDVIGRLGGDEFLIVLCHQHSSEGEGVVRRIHRSLAGCRIQAQGHMFPLAASVGVALARCDSDTDPMMLVHQADEAMYEAKKAARAAREQADAEN